MPRNPHWGHHGSDEITGDIDTDRIPDDIPDEMPSLIMPHVRPANMVFSPEELEARIIAHMKRVQAELKRQQLSRDSQPAKRKKYLPLHMDTKVVSCASCRVTLLAPSDEHMRKLKTGVEKHLPPPVAMYAAGRPYCDDCVDGPCMRI